jgi:hypothetical protein
MRAHDAVEDGAFGGAGWYGRTQGRVERRESCACAAAVSCDIAFRIVDRALSRDRYE